jgi:hypothetical protein
VQTVIPRVAVGYLPRSGLDRTAVFQSHAVGALGKRTSWPTAMIRTTPINTVVVLNDTRGLRFSRPASFGKGLGCGSSPPAGTDLDFFRFHRLTRIELFVAYVGIGLKKGIGRGRQIETRHGRRPTGWFAQRNYGVGLKNSKHGLARIVAVAHSGVMRCEQTEGIRLKYKGFQLITFPNARTTSG